MGDATGAAVAEALAALGLRITRGFTRTTPARFTSVVRRLVLLTRSFAGDFAGRDFFVATLRADFRGVRRDRGARRFTGFLTREEARFVFMAAD
jgi:hypothetical protein